MTTLKRQFLHLMISVLQHSYGGNCWYSALTVDEQRGEKEGFLLWTRSKHYPGGRLCNRACLLSYLSCALQQLCPDVVAKGNWRAQIYQQVVLCGCLLHGVSRLNACAQSDLTYVRRADPVLSSKVGHPFCMPFLICPYVTSLTVGWLFSSDGFFVAFETVPLWYNMVWIFAKFRTLK